MSENTNSHFSIVSTIDNTLLDKINTLSNDAWNEYQLRKMYTILGVTFDNSIVKHRTKDIILIPEMTKLDSNGRYYTEKMDFNTRQSLKLCATEEEKTAKYEEFIIQGKIKIEYAPTLPQSENFKNEIQTLSNTFTEIYGTGRIVSMQLLKTNETRENSQSNKINRPNDSLINGKIYRHVIPLVASENILFKIVDEMKPLDVNVIYKMEEDAPLEIINQQNETTIIVRATWRTYE